MTSVTGIKHRRPGGRLINIWANRVFIGSNGGVSKQAQQDVNAPAALPTHIPRDLATRKNNLPTTQSAPLQTLKALCRRSSCNSHIVTH